MLFIYSPRHIKRRFALMSQHSSHRLTNRYHFNDYLESLCIPTMVSISAEISSSLIIKEQSPGECFPSSLLTRHCSIDFVSHRDNGIDAGGNSLQGQLRIHKRCLISVKSSACINYAISNSQPKGLTFGTIIFRFIKLFCVSLPIGLLL